MAHDLEKNNESRQAYPSYLDRLQGNLSAYNREFYKNPTSIEEHKKKIKEIADYFRNIQLSEIDKVEDGIYINEVEIFLTKLYNAADDCGWNLAKKPINKALTKAGKINKSIKSNKLEKGFKHIKPLGSYLNSLCKPQSAWRS